jgi:hypothetical protein
MERAESRSLTTILPTLYRDISDFEERAEGLRSLLLDMPRFERAPKLARNSPRKVYGKKAR